MTDAIDAALLRNGSPTITTTTSEPDDQRIKKLPLIKTPELIQREAEASAQHSKAESDRSTLLQREESEVESKKVTYAANSQEYPKIKKYVEMCSKLNEARDARIKTSNANIKLSKTAFTFPMKRVSTGIQSDNVMQSTNTSAPIKELPLKPYAENTEPVDLPISPTPTPTQTPTPTPTPTPSARSSRGDFYAKTKITFGSLYSTITVYYKDTQIFTDNTYSGKRADVADVERYLSRRTCSQAASLISNGSSLEWTNDSRIRNGCANTLNDQSGGFSIGQSNIILE